MNLAALTQLLQLSSPSLPVGAYSYSQGLEAALHQGVVRTPDEVETWIRDHLLLVLGRGDAPYWWRLARAWTADDVRAAAQWNEEFLASRDGAELRAESIQMGFSLAALLEALVTDEVDSRLKPLTALEPVSFPAAFTWAAVAWKVPLGEALLAWLWSWLDAQVLAYLKTGAAGQVAGQRMLARLSQHLPGIVDESERCPDDALASFAPGVALMSYAHETQDGRLFRS